MLLIAVKCYFDNKNSISLLYTKNICKNVFRTDANCPSYTLLPQTSHRHCTYVSVNPCTVLPTQFLYVKCYGAKSAFTISMEKLRGDPFIPPDYPNGKYESLRFSLIFSQCLFLTCSYNTFSYAHKVVFLTTLHSFVSIHDRRE